MTRFNDHDPVILTRGRPVNDVARLVFSQQICSGGEAEHRSRSTCRTTDELLVGECMGYWLFAIVSRSGPSDSVSGRLTTFGDVI